jgi:hypothetical protein
MATGMTKEVRNTCGWSASWFIVDNNLMRECVVVRRGKKMNAPLVEYLFPKGEVDDKKKPKKKENAHKHERDRIEQRYYICVCAKRKTTMNM